MDHVYTTVLCHPLSFKAPANLLSVHKIVDLLLASEDREAGCLSRTGPQLGQLSARPSCSRICTVDCISILPVLVIWNIIYADISLIV